MQDDAPVVELYLPASQDRHAVLPVVGLYLPASQDRHAAEDVLPVVGLYVPAAQLVQDDWPTLGLYVPAAHAAQFTLPITLHSVEPHILKPQVRQHSHCNVVLTK